MVDFLGRGEGRSTTHRTLDTELEVIPQSRKDSGPRNYTTGNTKESIFGAMAHEGSWGPYPIPSRNALSKISLNKSQKAESAEPQYNAPKSEVVCPESHDAKTPGWSIAERERVLIMKEHIRTFRWHRQAGDRPVVGNGGEWKRNGRSLSHRE